MFHCPCGKKVHKGAYKGWLSVKTHQNPTRLTWIGALIHGNLWKDKAEKWMRGTKAVNSHTRVASWPQCFLCLWCVNTETQRQMQSRTWDSQLQVKPQPDNADVEDDAQEAFYTVLCVDATIRNINTFKKAFFSKWFIKNGGMAAKTQNIIAWCIFIQNCENIK